MTPLTTTAINAKESQLKRYGITWERFMASGDTYPMYRYWPEEGAFFEIMRVATYKGGYYPWGLLTNGALADAYHSVNDAMKAAQELRLSWELER